MSVTVTFLDARSLIGFESESGEELVGMPPATLVVGFVWVFGLGPRVRRDRARKGGTVEYEAVVSIEKKGEITSVEDVRVAAVCEDLFQCEELRRNIYDEFRMSGGVQGVSLPGTRCWTW